MMRGLGQAGRRAGLAGLCVIASVTMLVALAPPAGASRYTVGYIRKTDGVGKFKDPGGIAIEPVDGNMYIVNTMANTLGFYDPIGDPGGVSSLSAPLGVPQLDRPIDVAVTGNSNVWIVDLGHHVQVWDRGSSYIGSIDQTGDFDLAVDTNHQGGIFLSTWYPGTPGAGQIKVYGVNGTFIFQFGIDVIRKPVGVAFGSDGLMYVADELANKVWVFGPGGKLLRSFGQAGTGPGQFNGPAAIASDERDNIYIAMRGNHRVDKFDRFGRHLASMAPKRTTGLQFSPTGIDVHPVTGSTAAAQAASREVVVTDDVGNRVVIFDTTEPRTHFTGPRRTAFHTARQTFHYASPTDGTFECRLDGQPWFACNDSSHSVSVSADQGHHRFRVRAIDRQGVEDSAPAVRAFRVERHKPTVTTSSEFVLGPGIPHTAGLSQDAENPFVHFSWTGSDPGTKPKNLTYLFEGSPDTGQPFGPAGSFTHDRSTAVAISPTAHPAFRVTVKDPAGNTSRRAFDEVRTDKIDDVELAGDPGYGGVVLDAEAVGGYYSKLTPGQTFKQYFNGRSAGVIAKQQPDAGFGTARICVGNQNPGHCKVVDAATKAADREFVYVFNGTGQTGTPAHGGSIGDNQVWITPLTGVFPLDGIAVLK